MRDVSCPDSRRRNPREPVSKKKTEEPRSTRKRGWSRSLAPRPRTRRMRLVK
jgi:hypothetical protein